MRLTTTGNIAFLVTFFPTSLFLSPFSLSLSLCLSFFMSLANQRQVERERERWEGRKSKGVFLRWRILEFLAGRAVGGRGEERILAAHSPHRCRQNLIITKEVRRTFSRGVFSCVCCHFFQLFSSRLSAKIAGFETFQLFLPTLFLPYSTFYFLTFPILILDYFMLT